MLRIHDIEKLEGAKLDKRNMYVVQVKAVAVYDGNNAEEYYEFGIGKKGSYVEYMVRLCRDYRIWNDGNPVYQMFNVRKPNDRYDISFGALKNKDIVIDNIRLIALL